VPLDLAAAVSVPALVLPGGESYEFLHETAGRLVAALPDGRHVTPEGQGHAADPAVVNAAVVPFSRCCATLAR
jgi:hypothetical protein